VPPAHHGLDVVSRRRVRNDVDGPHRSGASHG
jgi:hypothetical protein